MPQYTYPGVYVQEIPGGVHSVTGVATSTAAFIDFFKEGPLNQAVHITSQADFDRIFGGLDTRSEAGYAISQFFLNGGTEAYVVRTAAKSTGSQALATAKATVLDASTTATFLVAAGNEGSWGNRLRLEIDPSPSDPTLFNLRAIRYDHAGAQAIKVESFLNISMDSSKIRFAPTVVNDQSSLIQVSPPSAGMTWPRPNGTLSNDLSQLSDFDSLKGLQLPMAITTAAGAVIGTATAVLDTWASGSVTDLRGLRPYLEKAIQTSDRFSPAFSEAKVELLNHRFRITLGKKANNYSPDQLLVFSGAIAQTLQLPTAATDSRVNVQQYALQGGGDGAQPGAQELVGSRQTEPFTGLYALDYADLFNILCMPRAAELNSDSEMQYVLNAALQYCSDRRAFMIIDLPASVGIGQLSAAQSWVDIYRHPNAAVYFPRLQQPDPQNEFRLRSVGASGTMAGMFARIDSSRGVWKAPAGTEAVLRGVSGLDVSLTDAENGVLNPLAINCFRNFPVYGMVAWGARTLYGSDQAASEWKYIPVRRLALFLEESLFRGTKWVVFEPNDEPLWAKIRLNLNAFMMSLFRQGAFQGTDPSQAFYVKCDSATTTQDDRNHGIVNIEVGFAPLKPAEFVVLKFQQIAGQN